MREIWGEEKRERERRRRGDVISNEFSWSLLMESSKFSETLKLWIPCTLWISLKSAHECFPSWVNCSIDDYNSHLVHDILFLVRGDFFLFSTIVMWSNPSFNPAHPILASTTSLGWLTIFSKHPYKGITIFSKCSFSLFSSLNINSGFLMIFNAHCFCLNYFWWRLSKHNKSI